MDREALAAQTGTHGVGSDSKQDRPRRVGSSEKRGDLPARSRLKESGSAIVDRRNEGLSNDGEPVGPGMEQSLGSPRALSSTN